jgi:hypothetical protein
VAELGGGVPQTAVETLSGALATAESMSSADALQLIAHARAAYTEGMRWAMLIAALVTVASGVLVYLRLGRPRLRSAAKTATRQHCQNAQREKSPRLRSSTFAVKRARPSIPTHEV